jgi:hypothetical protein
VRREEEVVEVTAIDHSYRDRMKYTDGLNEHVEKVRAEFQMQDVQTNLHNRAIQKRQMMIKKNLTI